MKSISENIIEKYYNPVLLSVSAAEIKIVKKDLLTEMGYSISGYPGYLDDYIDEILFDYPQNRLFSAGYLFVDSEDWEILDSLIKCKNVYFNCGRTVAHAMRKSEKGILFMLSAGADITETAKDSSSSSDQVRKYVFDVFGTVVAEKIADYLHSKFRSELESLGMKCSNRYSPGYCGWLVSEQQKFFSLFPENFCGISLSGSSLMHPVKSISAMFGIGKDVIFENYQCAFCEMDNCHRNKYWKNR